MKEQIMSYLLVAVNNKKFEDRKCDWIAGFNDIYNLEIGHVDVFYVFGKKKEDIKITLEKEVETLEAVDNPSENQKALYFNICNLVYLLNQTGIEVELTGYIKTWGQKNNVSIKKENSILVTVPN